ncbi:metallophosphoesterase, partial [Patescibacteria group bacterium]|nr:metallophosphoesterase [Patescibacteria group bacterium]
LLETSESFYYSFDYGPVHVAVVDQYTADYSVGSAQYNWLADDLSKTKKKWKVVMFHAPAWSAGHHENDVTAQESLGPLMETNGVSAVLQGHNHYYARNEVNGIHYLTLGGGGAPLYTPDLEYPNLADADPAYHFARFDMTQNTFNVSVIDEAGTEIDSFALENKTPTPRAGFIATTPYSAGGPQVTVNKYDGLKLASFMAYDSNLRGEFQVQTGDIDGDTYDEIITAPGNGNKAPVKIFEMDGRLKKEFYPYGENFSGGVEILAADLNADGKQEIITAPETGGGANVRVHTYENDSVSLLAWTMAFEASYHGGAKLGAGNTDSSSAASELLVASKEGRSAEVKAFSLNDGVLSDKGSFKPYGDAFMNGVNLIGADLNGNSQDEVIVAPLSGGGPNVRVYNYTNSNFALLDWEMVYDKNFKGGLELAAGDFDANGSQELVVAPVVSGGPNVRVYNFQNSKLELLDWFMAFDPGFHAGINIAADDVDNDSKAELVVTPKHGGPNVRTYDLNGSDFALKSWYWAFAPSFVGGVNVAVGSR